MKRTLAAGLLFALTRTFGVTAHAQDETPGSQSTITMSVPTFACGRATQNEYCYGVPTSLGGNHWIDVYPNGYSNNHINCGFILFNGVADLGGIAIANRPTITKDANGNVGSMTVTFAGTTADDVGTYTGTETFTFSCYKGGNLWSQTITGATLAITYN
jgi:hypothetical protein